MRLIEITGIPGSGKSTILPIVKSYIKSIGFDVFDSNNIIQCSESLPFNKRYLRKLLVSLPTKLSDKILRALHNYSYQYKLKYLVNNFQLFTYVLSLTSSRPISEHHKILIIQWFLDVAGRYQIARESLGKDSALILDEGFVHKVVTFFVSVEEKTLNVVEIDKYLEMIPTVHTLINVEADEVLCRNRIIARKLPRRLEGRSINEISEYLSRSKSAIDYSLSSLAKRGSKIVTLSNFSEQFSKENIMLQVSMNFRDF